MGSVCIAFGASRNFTLDIILALFFGIGFGIFSAIDWALATDVLPNDEDYAKDMGLWNLAFTLPQVVSGYLSGYVIDHFKSTGSASAGWFVVFFGTSISFLIGTYLIKFIDDVH